MLFKNPNSNRENPFNKIYRDEKFSNILQNKENLPDFPYFIDIELTNHCNLQCVFCGQQAMYRHKGFMSEELLKKIADECSQFNTPIRFIRWGEPFLHPKIIEFCEYIFFHYDCIMIIFAFIKSKLVIKFIASVLDKS